jgi:hypothetical protein
MPCGESESRNFGAIMRVLAMSVGIFGFLASCAAVSAQYQYQRPAAPMNIAPRYQVPPAQDECPQGRQIRAQKPYPASMTDCQVLDADTAVENDRIHRLPPLVAATAPASSPRPYDPAKIENLISPDVAGSTKLTVPPNVILADDHIPAKPVVFGDSLKDPANDDLGSALARLFADLKKSSWGILAGLLALYFAPALIAGNRGHHNALAIAALNLFLGWSFFGWVIAFVWACTRVSPSASVDSGDVLVRREPRL